MWPSSIWHSNFRGVMSPPLLIFWSIITPKVFAFCEGSQVEWGVLLPKSLWIVIDLSSKIGKLSLERFPGVSVCNGSKIQKWRDRTATIFGKNCIFHLLQVQYLNDRICTWVKYFIFIENLFEVFVNPKQEIPHNWFDHFGESESIFPFLSFF